MLEIVIKWVWKFRKIMILDKWRIKLFIYFYLEHTELNLKTQLSIFVNFNSPSKFNLISWNTNMENKKKSKNNNLIQFHVKNYKTNKQNKQKIIFLKPNNVKSYLFSKQVGSEILNCRLRWSRALGT